MALISMAYVEYSLGPLLLVYMPEERLLPSLPGRQEFPFKSRKGGRFQNRPLCRDRNAQRTVLGSGGSEENSKH